MIANESNTAKEKTPQTVIHEILKAPSLPLSGKEIHRINDEVGTVPGADIETVAQTLRLIIYYLYSDRKILSRLRAELTALSDIHSSDAEVPLKELEQLPYLTAVIMEGLRLSPDIATRMARIAPDRDFIYDKWAVPSGTPVGMTTLLMHHNEAVYKEDRKFSPERWTDMERRRKAEKTFAPFSRGTRICLGMHLARAELYLTLSMLVTHFDLEFVNTRPEDVDCDGDQFIIGTKGENGVRVIVTHYQK